MAEALAPEVTGMETLVSLTVVTVTLAPDTDQEVTGTGIFTLVGTDCHVSVVTVKLAPDRDQEATGTGILASMGILILTGDLILVVRPPQPVHVSDSLSLLESLRSLYPGDRHLNQNLGLRLLNLCSTMYRVDVFVEEDLLSILMKSFLLWAWAQLG